MHLWQGGGWGEGGVLLKDILITFHNVFVGKVSTKVKCAYFLTSILIDGLCFLISQGILMIFEHVISLSMNVLPDHLLTLK